MNKLLLIALGGAAGTLLRYGLSGLAYRVLGATFPWGTLVVNTLGCFVIGLLWSLSERIPYPPGVTLFVFVGLLGAFTTFSTYSLESLNLIRDGEIMLGLLNVVASNVLGLLLVFGGALAGRLLLTLYSP